MRAIVTITITALFWGWINALSWNWVHGLFSSYTSSCLVYGIIADMCVELDWFSLILSLVIEIIYILIITCFLNQLFNYHVLSELCFEIKGQNHLKDKLNISWQKDSGGLSGYGVFGYGVSGYGQTVSRAITAIVISIWVDKNVHKTNVVTLIRLIQWTSESKYWPVQCRTKLTYNTLYLLHSVLTIYKCVICQVLIIFILYFSIAYQYLILTSNVYIKCLPVRRHCLLQRPYN